MSRPLFAAVIASVVAGAMLSAGAAHELASPLSTIALASGELLRRLQLVPGPYHSWPEARKRQNGITTRAET